MTETEERMHAVALIDEAVAHGARQEPACAILGISPYTYRRWRSRPDGDARPRAKRPRPAHALNEAERSEVLAICHKPEYRSLSPAQIVPALADTGRYLASESTMYRILHEYDEQHHRGRTAAPRTVGPPQMHTATRPNQVWSWDVTYLPGPVRGLFFYLYMIIDIFSRKIVGWEVWDEEASAYAVTLVERAVLAEQCIGLLEVLHNDRGPIQRAATLRVKLGELGVEPSFSRPRVSNDNAYSESLFRTCKYRPDYPVHGFADLAAARRWVYQFVEWYNHVHLHSAIRFVTPADRHAGRDVAILAERRRVYEAAREANPARWSKQTRNWEAATVVHLNKSKDEELKVLELA